MPNFRSCYCHVEVQLYYPVEGLQHYVADERYVCVYKQLHAHRNQHMNTHAHVDGSHTRGISALKYGRVHFSEYSACWTPVSHCEYPVCDHSTHRTDYFAIAIEAIHFTVMKAPAEYWLSQEFIECITCDTFPMVWKCVKFKHSEFTFETSSHPYETIVFTRVSHSVP